MKVMIDAMKALCVLVLLAGFNAYANTTTNEAQDVHHFESDADRALYLELNAQLRCPKCQNQNIADSDANIAKDLRAKVYKLVNEGKSKTEIIDYMVERYGYFVYYKPPFNAGTMILWILPIVFVLFTMLLIWRKSKSSLEQTDNGDWSDEQQVQLDELIAQIERGGKG